MIPNWGGEPACEGMLKEDITLLINAVLEISGRQVIQDDHKVYRATNF